MEVKFTEYSAEVDYFIDFIGREMNRRDLAGATFNRIQVINVTAEHPLVMLTGPFLAMDATSFNESVAGILPSISVVEGDETENERSVTIGQGIRRAVIIDESVVDGWKASAPDMDRRVSDMMLTDQQMEDLKTIIRKSSAQKVLMKISTFYLVNDITVSLWTEQIADRQILGRILRSVIYDMRLDMIKEPRKLKDILITTNRGLTNFNFGRVLRGQETNIRYINTVTVNTVDGEEPIDTNLPVNLMGTYSPVDRPEDEQTIIWNLSGETT